MYMSPVLEILWFCNKKVSPNIYQTSDFVTIFRINIKQQTNLHGEVGGGVSEGHFPLSNFFGSNWPKNQF